MSPVIITSISFGIKVPVRNKRNNIALLVKNINSKAIMGIDNINYCDYNMEEWILQAGLSWVPPLLCISCVSQRKNSLLGLCLILLAGFSVTSTFISTKWVEFHICWYIAGTALFYSLSLILQQDSTITEADNHYFEVS